MPLKGLNLYIYDVILKKKGLLSKSELVVYLLTAQFCEYAIDFDSSNIKIKLYGIWNIPI